MQTTLVLNAVGFTLGFWWICYQIGINFAKVMTSIIGGVALGFAGIYGLKFASHDAFANHLALLPVASLMGATVLLWVQARKQLAQKLSRDSIYLLTLTFVYFFSPWEGAFRVIGLMAAAPCLLVLLFCILQKDIKTEARVGLMFWTMIVSLAMGVQQLMASPETLLPVKNASVGSTLLTASLSAAGLMTLAISLVPFIDWFRGVVLKSPDTVEHEMMNDPFSFKRAMALAIVHGAPLVLNYKYHYVSYETMVGYSLVWSPLISSTLADALEPEAPAEIPGWDQDATRAS